MSGSAFLIFILLSLCSYRATRLITTDQFPPAQWLRDGVEARFGRDSGWDILFHCSWCIGFWLTLAVFSWAWYFIDIPYPLLQAVAGSTVVGYLGSKEND